MSDDALTLEHAQDARVESGTIGSGQHMDIERRTDRQPQARRVFVLGHRTRCSIVKRTRCSIVKDVRSRRTRMLHDLTRLRSSVAPALTLALTLLSGCQT